MHAIHQCIYVANKLLIIKRIQAQMERIFSALPSLTVGWCFKDELNFLIYCIQMGNIISFILNVKFANVTYCTRE